MIRKITDSDYCEHKECKNKATYLVYSRKKEKVLACCIDCSDEVVDEGSPEYQHECENCKCVLPIN